MDPMVNEFNQNFQSSLSDPNATARLQEAGRQFVKVELMESAYSRALIPQEPITTADCQRNVNDNSLYLLRDIEPTVQAIGVDNFGEPDGSYVSGQRYLIPIINFKTKRFQITVEDLRAYQYKITKRIEEKSVPILEKLEDKYVTRILSASIGASAATSCKCMLGENSTGASGLYMTTKDIVNVQNLLTAGAGDTKKKEVGTLLMTQETYKTAVVLPSAGDDFGKDRILNGISSDVLFGCKVATTIKNDIIPIGHIWAVTKPDFLGHNFALGDPTFEIKSTFGLIEWQTGESVGFNVGNRLSVAILTLVDSVVPAAYVNSAGATIAAGSACKVSTLGTYPEIVWGWYNALKV
jgi:hypothetical protein